MRRIVLASLLALATTVGIAARLAVAADPPAGVAAAGLFKNLKVLPKNISKADLKAVMKAQSKALGVDCDHCHEEPNMDKETPHKELARQMMKMTNDINANWLKGIKEAAKNPVTCGSCHRGEVHPPKF